MKIPTNQNTNWKERMNRPEVKTYRPSGEMLTVWLTSGMSKSWISWIRRRTSMFFRSSLRRAFEESHWKCTLIYLFSLAFQNISHLKSPKEWIFWKLNWIERSHIGNRSAIAQIEDLDIVDRWDGHLIVGKLKNKSIFRKEIGKNEKEIERGGGWIEA